MFVVDCQPTAIAHPHDHPFEEAYVFVEGEVHALVDGELLVLHPGDVLWAGVGADHGFENHMGRDSSDGSRYRHHSLLLVTPTASVASENTCPHNLDLRTSRRKNSYP